MPINMQPEDDRELLVCPTCGFDYVTLRGAHVVDTDDNYTPVQSAFISPNGFDGWQAGDPNSVHSKDSSGHMNRGHAIALEGFCENGHEWRLVFERHKGYTYFRVETLPDADWLAAAPPLGVEPSHPDS